MKIFDDLREEMFFEEDADQVIFDLVRNGTVAEYCLYHFIKLNHYDLYL